MNALKLWLSENGLVIIGMLIAAVTVRGIVKFDVNQWLNDRRAQRLEKLTMLCPLVRIDVKGNTFEVYSTYISPPGTIAYQCQRCGHITHDGDAIDAQIRYWVENPSALMKRNKKMEKIAKKLGR